jgi:hypothetical protein
MGSNEIRMNRWPSFLVCAALGLLLLLGGLLVPAHLRAVDAGVLSRAGRTTPGLVPLGLELARQGDLGAAQLVSDAAQAESLPGHDQLAFEVANLAHQFPEWRSWGGGNPRLETLFENKANPAASAFQPLTPFAIRTENRARMLDMLGASQYAAVQELLRCRALTNTVILPSSQSASGQAFDASVAICGLLLEEGQLTPGLGSAIHALAHAANQGESSQPIEETLMDLLSLGQRMNWNQLSLFVAHIEDPKTLHVLADLARKSEARLPVLFSAVELSGNPAAVASYITHYSQSGLTDLGSALRFGAGGASELLRRDQRLYVPGWESRGPLGGLASLAGDYSWRMPSLALPGKWVLYLLAGFFLAMALHFARPAVSSLERPLQVRGFHLFREVLFALGFLFVVLLLSEPFLAQENQKAEFAFRLRLPMMGGMAPAGRPGMTQSLMNQNQQVYLTMLLFFVLQSLLYIACLVKLAEIRRQRIPSRMKLKLLENEDHLFDAGLYLGFLGTIISFILVSIGVFKQPSLMAAYSSTSFGIIFVSAFKIFHLRAARRKLLLEAEEPPSEEVQAPVSARVAATV